MGGRESGRSRVRKAKVKGGDPSAKLVPSPLCCRAKQDGEGGLQDLVVNTRLLLQGEVCEACENETKYILLLYVAFKVTLCQLISLRKAFFSQRESFVKSPPTYRPRPIRFGD